MLMSNIPDDCLLVLAVAKKLVKQAADRIRKAKSRRKLNIKVPMGKNGKLVTKEYVSQKGCVRTEYFRQYRLNAQLKLRIINDEIDRNYNIDSAFNEKEVNGEDDLLVYEDGLIDDNDDGDDAKLKFKISTNSLISQPVSIIINNEIISSITTHFTDEHLNKSSYDGKQGKSIISIAFGNVLDDDETRYRAAVIFAFKLFERNVIGKSDSPWNLSVVMRKNYFSDTYKLLLEKVMCRVIYVDHPADKIYMYSIERYFAIDDPTVFRFISLDSHWLWNDSQINRFLASMENWYRSEKPIIGFVCNHMDSREARQYGGGYFGVQRINYNIIMDIRQYADIFLDGVDRNAVVRGIDEIFLTWFLGKINHGRNSDLFYDAKNFLDSRKRIAGIYANPNVEKVCRLYLNAELGLSIS